jgi:hypothetical protein
MYNNNDDVSLHSSTKLCKQFTSYNFHPSLLILPAQCSWKAAVKWNNVNNNIPQQTIFFSLLVLLMFGRFGLAAEKMYEQPRQPTFVCYYSILILFFLDSWILSHPARFTSRRPTSLSVLFFHSLFFFFFHGSHDMEWRKLYCYLFSTVSHIHSLSAGGGEFSGVRDERRKIVGSVVSEWTREPSRAQNEWEYKSVRWTHFCVLSCTQYYLYRAIEQKATTTSIVAS